MLGSTPLHPKRGSDGRPRGPTGMSKNIRPYLEEHRYNTISPRSFQARREKFRENRLLRFVQMLGLTVVTLPSGICQTIVPLSE